MMKIETNVLGGNQDDRKVSVALLTKNGMPAIRDLLTRLAMQRCSLPIEVIALDSGSVDGTVDSLAKAGVTVHQIEPQSFSFGPCRQRCFQLTHGEVIVTTSQDAVPEGPNWLESMVRPILNDECDVVLGGVRPPSTSRFFWTRVGKFYLVRPRWPFDHYPDLDCVSLAISRTAWAATGFGTVPINEDKYLAVRVRELGLRCERQGSSFVYHGHEYNIVELTKRCFNEGLGSRYTGAGYGIFVMLADVLSPRVWGTLARAVGRGEASAPAEVLFPLIRPAALLAGYWFGKRLWK